MLFCAAFDVFLGGAFKVAGGGVRVGAGVMVLMEVQVLSLVASTEGGPGAGPT